MTEAEIRADERERCAKLCEELGRILKGGTSPTANEMAATIRSLGAEPEDHFKAAVLRCRYPVCKTLHPSGWGWDTARLNEVIADHAAGALGTDGGQK